MLAAKVEAFSAIGDGPHEDGFLRTKIVAGVGLGQLLAKISADRDEIEDRGGKAADGSSLLVRHVARHGQGFEIHLRAHDRGTEAEEHAAFEAFDYPGEDQEI